MDSNANIDWEREEEHADAALDDVRRVGKTERRCLRCDGELLIYDAGSGYQIRCECDDCFSMTVRGL